MKRALTRAFCLVLSVVCLLSLVGCKQDQDAFVGKWQAKVNMTELLTEKIKAIPDYLTHFKISDFIVTVNYEFKEDGSYTVFCDEEVCTAAFEKAEAEFRDGIANMELASAKELGLDMTIEQILAEANTTMDEMVAKYFDKEILNNIFDFFADEGRYFKAEEGKFYRLDTIDTPIKETPYELYKIIDDTKIEIYDVLGSVFEQKKFVEITYPIVLERI